MSHPVISFNPYISAWLKEGCFNFGCIRITQDSYMTYFDGLRYAHDACGDLKFVLYDLHKSLEVEI